MKVYAIEHVQLAMPPNGEEAARSFYIGVLGLTEKPKPPRLAARGGVWFEQGDLKIHLGVEPDFRPAKKAHPALLVEGLDELISRCEQAGAAAVWDEPLGGFRRAHVNDPFGNRIELMEMGSKTRWYEERVEKWCDFTKLIDVIETRHERQQHHFSYRGQVNKVWGLEPSLFRELREKKEDLQRCFEIEHDAKKEFASQVHLYMDPSALPNSGDWLEWWALMQHYGAPTRLLDWTASPYVAAYFAIESGEDTDGLIWVLNDWALGDRMREHYPANWGEWDHSPRPTNNWSIVAKSFDSKRFFDETAAPQLFFFQPNRRSPRIVAQQGWLSASLKLFADCETTIAALYENHRNDPKNHVGFDSKTRECWKYWNCRIVIPKEVKREFLRRLQTMNITASALFPGVDGLGKSDKEFIKVEVRHDRPGSSHSLP
jgi:catechol 2,3-dioxygenase-like lactoylglutathione lyase family enzyme